MFENDGLGLKKTYLQGLIVAKCNFDIFYGKGYELYINQTKVGDYFKNIKDAEKMADDYVQVRVKRYAITLGYSENKGED